MEFGLSQYANASDFAFDYITGISIIILAGVTFSVLYFAIKYNHKRHPHAKQVKDNLVLETAWTIAPTIIVLSMFYVGYIGYSDNRKLNDHPDYIVKVIGQQFDWRFTYENGATLDTLFVPVNKITRFDITGLDVIHSFYIPSLRIKEDAVPGRTNMYSIQPNKIGSYDIACAEYCGVLHSGMYSKINVVSQNEYDKWYAEVTKTVAPPEEKKEEVKTEAEQDASSTMTEAKAEETKEIKKEEVKK